MAGVRLAEAVGALSLAVDLGMGQPLEQGLRTCLIATGLARRMSLDEDDARRVFYLSLLRHVGCTAESDIAASFLGDEVDFRSGAITLDFAKPAQMLPYMLRHVGATKAPLARARHVGRTLTGSKRFMGMMDSTCETAQLLATRLGFDTVVQAGLWQIYERWDGKGLPGRVGGEEIVLPARFVAMAELFEGLCRLEGLERAVEVVTERTGTAFAPEIAACLCRDSEALAPDFDTPSVWEDVLAAEPLPGSELADAELDEVLAAVADFTDLKSTYTLGHSRGVAELAAAAGAIAGLAATDVTTLRRAGLVHDVGRVGVSAGIWGKAKPLSRDDWERIRLHPYYTERVLTAAPALADLGRLASTHHERLDGAGYHRGASGAGLPRPARILAAADGYQARTEPRPHRGAMAAEEAAASLREEARNGSLDAEAVDVVLRAAGQGGSRRRRAQVGGLTDREVEVLALIVRGRSIREMAGALTISPKTADAHIQHIYTKIGVSTRAGATLFAVQNGLVEN